MGWAVEIVGNATIIQALADALTDPELRIRKVGDRFVIEADEFEQLTDAAAVREAARRLSDVLNGTAFLLLRARDALEIGSVTQQDGKSQSVWVFPEPAVGYGTVSLAALSVINADGTKTIHRPADPVRAWTREAAIRPAVRKALRLRAVPTLGWVELYRILEVVTTEVGLSQIVEHGWATRAELRRFKHTANNVAVSGDAARHGADREEPPAEPMTLAEGQGLLDRILTPWLGR